MKADKVLIWFLVITFGFSWLLFVLPLAFGPPEVTTPFASEQTVPTTRQIVTVVAWAVGMWGPGLAALIVTRYVMGEPLRTLNLGRLGPKRFYLWAWLLPPVFAIVAGLLTLALGAGQPDLELTVIRESMAEAPGGEVVSPELVIALEIAFSLTLAPLLNVLFALGEELGWRGFLLPRLLPLGQWPAILISGLIWGMWHAPAILQGLNYPGQPVLGVLMMIVFTVLLGTVFSWLYLETRSPWAPALAHGSLNATAGLSVLFMEPGVDIVVGGTTASLIGWIGLAVFVAWLALTRRLPVPRESRE